MTLKLLARQLAKQLWLGHKVQTMVDPKERAEYALVNAFACTDEVHEALREVNWKPWASAAFFNREAFLGELADAQLFLDNLKLLALGEGSVDELEREFHELCLRKVDQAIRRNDQGYDGVKDKCPSCRRDRSAATNIMGQDICPCAFNWTEQEDG